MFWLYRTALRLLVALLRLLTMIPLLSGQKARFIPSLRLSVLLMPKLVSCIR
nr:MAG TPA: hypothetical protein [Caudoviricetes sp.]DAT69710.1 MAG TPA: hypothetical protein [Caudoviricetes sp.]